MRRKDAEVSSISPDEVEVCLRVLAAAGDAGLPDDVRERLDQAVAGAHRRVKKRLKTQRLQRDRRHDQPLIEAARRFREEIPPTLETPGSGGTLGRLRRPKRCYVCKESYSEADADYHQLCPGCAEVNARRRHSRCDLAGRRAVITGGRVKIGFHTALKLLRDGADVVVTTRFPKDAARRFAQVPDFAEWSGRLHIYGADLLELNEVVGLIEAVGRRWDSLDILINNAAQTVFRPPEYYRELRAGERASLSGPAESTLFPAGRLDETGQPLDLRAVNSWVLRDADVNPLEWLQVHVVNSFVPFMLTSRLRPLMEASPHPLRHVVQVSAMEGSYAQANKTPRHPHTNMAKASLNMLTRTVADDYASAGIYLNSVDTGWVTDEKPHPGKTSHRGNGFRPPLDVVDGAARVYDPIVRGELGEPVHGQFLKDYRSVAW